MACTPFGAYAKGKRLPIHALMKIQIDIDLTPAELRQFLGLPDVAGLQEDMIDYVRRRVSEGADSFDPGELLRDTTTWGNKTVQRFLAKAASRLGAEEDEPEQDE